MGIITRRALIMGAGGFVALAGTGYAGSLALCGRAELASVLPLDRLDVALSQIHAPDRIARAWRSRISDAGTLAVFLAEPGLLAALAVDCPETRRTRFQTRFRADFMAGNVIEADRWIVSRSECLVAVLAQFA